MKNSLKLAVFALLVLVSVSCSQEEDGFSTAQDSLSREKIMVFADIDDFKSTLNLFNSFTGTSDYIEWSNQQEHTSAFKSDKISLEERELIPFIFLFILNENKEFQIGDKLINYSKGVFYENFISDSGELGSQNKIFATFQESTFQHSEKELTNLGGKLAISANGGEYKEWQEFVREKYRVGCGTPYNKDLRYRLVHYLIIQTISGPLFTQSDLLFKLRMSTKFSSWQYNNTTTERLFDVDLSGNWYIKNKYTNAAQTSTSSFVINEQNSCYNPLKGTWTYPIGNHNFVSGTALSSYVWDISLSGSVFHKVNGDTNEVNLNINW